MRIEGLSFVKSSGKMDFIVKIGICLAGCALVTSVAAAQETPAKPILVAPAASLSTRPLPILRVQLSRSVYRIHVDAKTGSPAMPKDVVAKAELINWPSDTPQPTTFTWHVFLDWDFKPYPTHHAINELKFEHPSPFPVNLSSQICGGRLKVIAKTLFDGQEITGQALADVLGENPPRSAVLRAFPPNRFGLLASKIGMAESGLRHFDNLTGLPAVSKTNDIGLMQLNIPTKAVTSPDQVWDWRANVKRGLEMMEDKRRTTVLASRGDVNRHMGLRDMVSGYEDVACVNFMRWYLGASVLPPPGIPELSSKPGSGMRPDDPDPDHVMLSQIERDLIRRYNGGREYLLALTADSSSLGIKRVDWQVDATRGGINPRRGDPDYVRHVLSARSGFVIPPPPKPAVSKHHRLRHRRRRR
jgi:hypothetical protein